MAVMNHAQRAGGAGAKWRTLHSPVLFRERLAVAPHTARELATRLTGLGYVVVPRTDGNGFKIGGVAQEVMGAFSSRRPQDHAEVTCVAGKYPAVIWLRAVPAGAVGDGAVGDAGHPQG